MTRYFQFLKTAVILAIAIFIQIAQVRSQSITSPQSTNFMLEAYNIRGRAFVNKDAVNVEGTPLLNTEWGRGEVRFKNGGIVKDIELKFETDNKILVVCKAGIRSAQALEILKRKAIKNEAYSLLGGVTQDFIVRGGTTRTI